MTMKPSTRKVVTRSPSRTVRILNLPGLLPSPVQAESSFEAAFILRAALMPTCAAIMSQPFKLPVSAKGYTPDFLQTFIAVQLKPSVVEIKPASKIKKYSDIFDRASEFLRQRNYEFYVVTERELFKDGIEQRVRLIRRYAKATIQDSCRHRITDVLRNHECGLPIGSLMRKAAVNLEVILHLLATRVLTTGPKLMIADSAIVRLASSCAMGEKISLSQWFGTTAWGERG